ncbi:GntT/GntP/DsdX family permease [Ancylobacter terrae]|uniref:GntT/GntP/DsdX family permease n=1 Tax=Ancylobacter sp. sgz301288 TaxID=3342077 RepID=UPI00385B7224
MFLILALYFAAAVLALAVMTAGRRVHPLVALIVVAIGFAVAAGMAMSQFGKAFGTGFAQAVNGLGLLVLAAAMMSEIADSTGATARLMAAARGCRRPWLPIGGLSLIGGLGSTPAAAFALLAPLRRALGGTERAALDLGLGLSAAHGALLPAPVMLASVTILGADWRMVLEYGAVAALAGVGAALLIARAGETALPEPAPDPIGDKPVAPRRAVLALLVTTAVLLAMLVTQSLGDIASEPFGGGPNREFLLGIGRPAVLLPVGVGLLLLLSWRWETGGLSQHGWAGRAIPNAASLILILGAAGGLQRIVQETGMPEMNAERLLDFLPVPALTLVIPFAVAAMVKTLQGSSLVAAITAAGMIAPVLGTLGLDDASGRALAALAIGAGAMAVSHVNDGLFWLVAAATGRTAAGTLLRFSLGTGVQAGIILAVLLFMRQLAL